MLFKLSLKNIKKSVKDYSIYFFTLVIAVAIFYIFNSMDAQNAMLDMTSSKHKLIEGLVFLLNYVSIFVSIILGFLIIYSNNFLIKRRKKEIGLYLTLGMSKKKVSFILVCETLMVGIVSLVIGSLLGILLSQGLSVIVARMFEVNLNSYRFVFSSAALIKTLIYFGVIYILVMIFNVISLSKNKVIDLLGAGHKNELVKFRNKYVMIISFILSIVMLVIAYKFLFDHCLLMMNSKTVWMLVCGALSVLLFFFSLSGFALTIIQKIKPIYYKGLNMFNLKQINNKINTSVISTTIISLMLLFTIGILAGSISLANAFNSGIEEANPWDFTLMDKYYDVYEPNNYQEERINLEKIKKTDGYNNYVKESIVYNTYGLDDITYIDALNKEDYDNLINKYGEIIVLDIPIRVLSETDYNKILKLVGKDSVDIKEDEYLELLNVDMALDYFGNSYKNGKTISINGHTLHPATKDVVGQSIRNSTSPDNDGTLVLDDSYVKNIKPKSSTLIGNYVDDIKNDEEFEMNFTNFLLNIDEKTSLVRTKYEMANSSLSLKVIITFIGLYLGIIFAIASVTILAIGELSESSDNKDRYRVLRQIGADEHMINKALFTQIFITFMLPLIVALFHAYFGLKEINSIIEAAGNIDVSMSIIITTLFMVMIYGGYFAVTYLSSKGIIKD